LIQVLARQHAAGLFRRATLVPAVQSDLSGSRETGVAKQGFVIQESAIVG
jgi:hypothetical protein